MQPYDQDAFATPLQQGLGHRGGGSRAPQGARAPPTLTGGHFCKFGGLLLAQKSCFGNGLGAAALLQQLNHLNANLLLKNRAGLLRLCPMNAVLLYLGACNTEKSLNDARHLLVLQRPCRCRSRTPIPSCLEAANPNPVKANPIPNHNYRRC